MDNSNLYMDIVHNNPSELKVISHGKFYEVFNAESNTLISNIYCMDISGVIRKASFNLDKRIMYKIEKGCEIDEYSGKVYFISSGDKNIKIGYAKNIGQRISSLQTANPELLKLIGYIYESVVSENDAHIRYASDHIRGEWFKYSRAMVEYINVKGVLVNEQ